MDLKVYEKETVKQPHGEDTDYYVPNVIDLIPQYNADESVLLGADILTEDNDCLEQECALATIWQRGNDLVDPNVGVRWSEALLGEITLIQLMEDIRQAVQNITLDVEVAFSSVTDMNGIERLQYELKAVA